MTIIIDRRNTKTTKNASNRDRFVKRYKKHIKKSLEDSMKSKGVTDSDKPVDVEINQGINEEDIEYDKDSGYHESVISGNDRFIKGDFVNKPDGDGEGGTGGDGEDEDKFLFTLTKEEFFDIYFSDMDLPNFIKEAMVDVTKTKKKRAGFIKEGMPARLDVLKTLQQSIMRRISCDKEDKKPPFIDDIDLRYRHYKDVPEPMLKAVMFCLMDVSGSMEEHHKALSKKFFIFLYLFLKKNYQEVDVRFIRYHHEARDCTEEEFFYDRDTGGTNVSNAINLVNKIIEDEYPLGVYNVYAAHTSDGDWGWDENPEDIITSLDGDLLDKLQYYAYLQVQTPREYESFGKGREKLYGILKESSHIGEKLNIETALHAEDIIAVLHNLFKKGD